MSEDTIFGKILRGEIPSEEVYADENYYAFRDIDPAAPTHILVIPRKPIAKVADATDADAELLGGLLLTARKVAAREGLTDYRLVINNGEGAGQSVFHIHVHILGGRSLSWPPG